MIKAREEAREPYDDKMSELMERLLSNPQLKEWLKKELEEVKYEKATWVPCGRDTTFLHDVIWVIPISIYSIPFCLCLRNGQCREEDDKHKSSFFSSYLESQHFYVTK